MSHVFLVEANAGEEDLDDALDEALPAGTKNYMTPAGHRRLKHELDRLARGIRPRLLEAVSSAGALGARADKGAYLDAKKRLNEAERRIRLLSRRLAAAEIVDPARQRIRDRVFFGATVDFADESGRTRSVTIVGIDEADPEKGRISWLSPVAKALIGASLGDTVRLRTPSGEETVDIVSIDYAAA